jgi:hypothetical protein
MKRIFKDDGSSMRRADEQARLQEIARELFKRFPEDKHRRDEQWRTLTNMSPDTLYRQGRKLRAEGQL